MINATSADISALVSYKITRKQSNLIDIFSNPENLKLTVQKKCDLAGINKRSYYTWLQNPDFLKALRMRNLAHVVASSHVIVKRVVDDAIDGKFMQQKMALEISGDYQPAQTPLVQQVIMMNNNTQPADVIDIQIADKLAGMISPTVKHVIDGRRSDDDSPTEKKT